MVDKSLIGKSIGTRTIEVEKGRLRFFASVIGESNPIYVDESAARDAGHASLPVPPSFLFCLESEAFASVSASKAAGFDPGRVLHGEQQFVYHALAYGGDTLTFDVRFVDAYEKKNGLLDFVVKESRVTNQNGKHIADLRAIIVQRNG